MTQEERDNLLLDLKKGQDKLIGRMDNLEEGQNKLINRVDNLEEGQKEMNQNLKTLSQTVAKIEVEHSNKLEILLDVVTSYPQKFDSIENRFKMCENKINKHADEIYYLNSKVQAF